MSFRVSHHRPSERSPLRREAGQVLRRRTWAAIVFGTVLVAGGCHDDMYNQVKHEPLEPSTFFADGRSSRPLEPGVIARGTLISDDAVGTGKRGDAFVAELPVELTRELLDRGHARFNIFCTPCHGLVGSGDGIVVERGFRRPPSYHTDRLRGVPDGQIFDVITHGFGAMPSLRERISVRDRWAIVAYVRTLQLSQAASVSDLTLEEHSRLSTEQRGGDAAPPRE